MSLESEQLDGPLDRISHNLSLKFPKESAFSKTVVDCTVRLIYQLSKTYSENKNPEGGVDPIYLKAPDGIAIARIGEAGHSHNGHNTVVRSFDIVAPTGAYTSGIFEWQKSDKTPFLLHPFFFSIILPESILIQFSNENSVKVFAHNKKVLKSLQEEDLILYLTRFYDYLLNTSLLTYEELRILSREYELDLNELVKKSITIRKIWSLNPHYYSKFVDQREREQRSRDKKRGKVL